MERAGKIKETGIRKRRKRRRRREEGREGKEGIEGDYNTRMAKGGGVPFEVKEIEAKGILSKCGIPGIDWVVNPYIGCRFGCKYCYASFMGRLGDFSS